MISLAFSRAEKVGKSTHCVCEAGTCLSVNRTLEVADHFDLIQRALYGGINKNIQLACLKNRLFGFLLFVFSLTGHQDCNKKKWLKKLVLLVTYSTNAH